jgi:hypothetical protein
MDLMIESEVVNPIEQGLLLKVKAHDLEVRAYVVIAASDLSVVESLVPLSVFKSGAQVHVGNINDTDDHTEQVVQILENMDPGDVVVYLCESALAYGRTLGVFGLAIA